MEKRYDILGGPEKSAVFAAFEHAYDEDVQVVMDFAAQTPSAKGAAIKVTALCFKSLLILYLISG